MAARKSAKRPAKKTAKKRASAKAKTKARSAKVGSASATKLQRTSPSFTVNDVAASAAFYRDVLGFVVDERWEQDGKLLGVMVRAGDAVFMLGQDDWKKGRDRRKGEGVRMYCETRQDVDALAKAITGRGGSLDQEPRDTPWGTRDFSLSDPDGYKITIAAETTRK